ncbi:AAA family ATPase [Actinomadura sp. J1-007]|nr:AAA family ATPase [Actinomadura sp. J1-007]
MMLDLARAGLDVFEGLEPLEERRRALIGLFDRRADDPSARERDMAVPYDRLEDEWAADAPDAALAVLPELAGPVAYLGWACAGFGAAHERLVAVLGEGEPEPAALARLLLAAETGAVPAELAVALGTARYEELRERTRALRAAFAVEPWQRELRAWLARGLVAGEADACRAWLDMAVRITGAVQGLPDAATSPRCRLPVHHFQHDVRRLFVRRGVPNPLAGRLAPPAPAPAARGERAGAPQGFGARLVAVPSGDEREPGEGAFDERMPDELDGIVGPASLRAALREAVAAAEDEGRPVRLMICGPEGSGRRTSAAALERALASRAAAGEALVVSDQAFASLPVSDAVLWLQARVRDCVEGRRPLVVRHLDAFAGHEPAGPPAAEELRRAMADHPGLHVIALCRTGGEERILAANPALARAMTVARTRDFGAADHAELFARTVRARGARVDRRVARAAAALLVRTPPQLNMRNARLTRQLADHCLARARLRGADEVVEADVPHRPLTPGAPVTDPLAELAACAGIEPVKREVRALVTEAKAAGLRHEAGMTAHVRSRHLVFAGGPGTGKTTVAGILGRLYAELGVLTSGHLVQIDRADLTGPYPSETGPRVRRAVERALGGVLLVDNAHLLDPAGSPRDAEAADALVAAVEAYPGDVVVVLAAPDAGLGGLRQARPDLARLFPRTVRFPDLTAAELVEVFAARAAADGFELGEGVLDRVAELVRDAPEGVRHGNARLMAALLDRTVARQGRRVLTGGALDEDPGLDVLTVADVPRPCCPPTGRRAAAPATRSPRLNGSSGWRESRRRSGCWSPRPAPNASAATRGSPSPARPATWSSPATPGPPRPPSRGCSRRSTRGSACCRPATWSR